jgi:hypothetical protein
MLLCQSVASAASKCHFDTAGKSYSTSFHLISTHRKISSPKGTSKRRLKSEPERPCQNQRPEIEETGKEAHLVPRHSARSASFEWRSDSLSSSRGRASSQSRTLSRSRPSHPDAVHGRPVGFRPTVLSSKSRTYLFEKEKEMDQKLCSVWGASTSQVLSADYLHQTAQIQDRSRWRVDRYLQT